MLSVVGRGDTLLLFEDAAEIQGVIVADDGGYFCYIIISAFQQADRVVDSNAKDVLHGRLCGDFLKFLQKVTDTHISGQGILFDIDVFVVMLLEISSGNTHFLL